MQKSLSITVSCQDSLLFIRHYLVSNFYLTHIYEFSQFRVLKKAAKSRILAHLKPKVTLSRFVIFSMKS